MTLPARFFCTRKGMMSRQNILIRPLTYSYLAGRNHTSLVLKRLYSSSIFVSDRDSHVSANFQFDENLQKYLSNLPKLKADLEKRGVKHDVETLAAEYKDYLQMNEKRLKLEEKRALVSKTIAQVVKVEEEQIKSKESTEMIQELRAEGKQLKTELKALLPRFWNLEEKMMLQALALPNEIAPDVTDKELVIQDYFEDRKISLPGGHLEALKNHGVKLSSVGNKAYYLRGRLAILEQHLIQTFSEHLRHHGYLQICCPEMFKTSVVEGSGLDVTDRELVYRLQSKAGQTEGLSDFNQDLFFLRGSSALSFLAFLARTEMLPKDLPFHMFSIGRHYFPDNQNTKALPGLLGALQSYKVSLCSVVDSNEACARTVEELLPFISKIYSTFKLPFRLVQCPVSRLMPVEQKKIEIQMWVPSLQDYLEVGSLSIHGDYNSRRLMIRSSAVNQSSNTSPVFMVHSSLADITRLLAILVEYKQTDRKPNSC